MSMRSLRTRPVNRRILGIDPGYGRVGYGLIRVAGNTCSEITHGCITTANTHSRPRRLWEIARALRKILKQTRPDIVAIETLFFSKNVRTAMGVSEARGVISLVVEETGCPIVEFTPVEVKLAVTGYGQADKRQVQKLVESILKISRPITSDDAADALGIALCATQVRLK